MSRRVEICFAPLGPTRTFPGEVLQDQGNELNQAFIFAFDKTRGGGYTSCSPWIRQIQQRGSKVLDWRTLIEVASAKREAIGISTVAIAVITTATAATSNCYCRYSLSSCYSILYCHHHHHHHHCCCSHKTSHRVRNHAALYYNVRHDSW